MPKWPIHKYGPQYTLDNGIGKCKAAERPFSCHRIACASLPLLGRPCKRTSAMNTSLFSSHEAAILSRLLNKAAPAVAKSDKAASTPVEASKLAMAAKACPEPQKAVRKPRKGLKLAADLLPMAATLDELPDCLSW